MKIKILLHSFAYFVIVTALASKVSAKEIRLKCVTSSPHQSTLPPTIIVLDPGTGKIWTQGTDGALHERQLKALTKETLIFEDNTLIDFREYDKGIEDKLNFYLEQKSTYKVNRVDGYMEFSTAVRTSPYDQFREFQESGVCETTEKTSVF